MWPTLTLLALLFLGDAPSSRTIRNHVITSPAAPAIQLKVDKQLKYLGSFSFILGGVASGERHIWVKADRKKHVERLFILQFEGYLPGSPHRYNYQPRNVIRLGDADYNSNGFFYDDTAYHREHPGNEAEGTRKFLEARGYHLDAQQLLFRFYRSLPHADPAKDHRDEFLIFYIEPLKDLGITMKETTEKQDTERERRLVEQARARALKAFSVLAPK